MKYIVTRTMHNVLFKEVHVINVWYFHTEEAALKRVKNSLRIKPENRYTGTIILSSSLWKFDIDDYDNAKGAVFVLEKTNKEYTGENKDHFLDDDEVKK